MIFTFFTLKTSQTALLFYKQIAKCEFSQSACLLEKTKFGGHF